MLPTRGSWEVLGHLAIVGATGAVGRECCALITERKPAFDRLSLFASRRSAGSRIEVAGAAVLVQDLAEVDFDSVDYAIFCAGRGVSHEYAAQAVRQGAVVIDNSSAFRMEPEVPLVVPEINAADLADHQGIIANPNCSTIILAVVLGPLHRKFGLRRVVVSTYQAASGAGWAAMEELRLQSADCLVGRDPVPQVFPHPIAFNLFSHDSQVGPDGYNLEERKMLEETRKILHAPGLALSATCVRVPVLRAHSEAVNLTFERPVTPAEARQILATAPGVELVDDPAGNHFPMPIEATGKDAVLVGRIRQDLSQPDNRGLELFLCGDQLRKGAALNAIQILERLTALRGN